MAQEREKNSTAPRWSLGILNDPSALEVPGSILLLSETSTYNEPLGLSHASGNQSGSLHGRSSRSASMGWGARNQKRTTDGKFILEPQPDDSLNDPLNWKVWRRDAALLSLGFYCMLGGGMTPILAAGYNEVASDYNIAKSQVALTTGLYMLGLGVGSVILSPTAILFGKRPVYLVAAICFILSAVWCALSPSFPSLIVARVFMGIAVSSVECLPSATIAEIFFLHEKGYRLGIYTLLLLGGKNLVPLVSAAIIQSLGWRWVFWIVAMTVGFGACLLFFFVPETFWDRTPTPHKQRRPRFTRSFSALRSSSISMERGQSRVGGFLQRQASDPAVLQATDTKGDFAGLKNRRTTDFEDACTVNQRIERQENNSSVVNGFADQSTASCETITDLPVSPQRDSQAPMSMNPPTSQTQSADLGGKAPANDPSTPGNAYTLHYQSQPPKSYLKQLNPWSGRLRSDNWFRVAARPFVLFAYPSILWSTLVYSLSIGWLIVLSESVSYIYENRDSYNFTALQTGLVYVSPFVGGILGTAVAGKCSDVVVRYMARRNGGIYEPEFRLIMAIPIAIFTTIGLMGYGWSAQERDFWFVPTLFFGFISFGCSLGSTTSITFAVDSYRQFAGEALVTLNFSKNIFHGLVFSLFFVNWLQSDGSREVFIVIGAIQLGCLLTTIPMYIYGKRARMWTVRRNFMGSL